MRQTETIACVTWESALEAIERMADTAYDNPGQFCKNDVIRLQNAAKAIDTALELGMASMKHSHPANALKFEIPNAERSAIVEQIMQRSTPWPVPPPQILITTPTNDNGPRCDSVPKHPSLSGERVLPRDLIDDLRPSNILKNLNEVNKGYEP